MTTLPNRVEITALSGTKPVKGMLVRLTIRAKSKNDYNFIVGPTDECGKAVITREELMSGANRMIDHALMDYGEFEHNYAEDMRAEVMRKKDIESALKAVELYGAESYPAGYIERLNLALQNSPATKGIKLDIVQR